MHPTRKNLMKNILPPHKINEWNRQFFILNTFVFHPILMQFFAKLSSLWVIDHRPKKISYFYGSK
jgi:hypothetical protein